MRKPFLAQWLSGPLRANRGLYGVVALAAVFINLFALTTSLFSMTVYDRVVPANATNSLIALSMGMAIVLVLDFTLRTLRGILIDHAGQRIDRAMADAVFDRLLTMPLARPRGSTGAFAGIVREIEPLRDFFTSATLTAIVDVPFAALFLVAVAVLGGPLVLVPLAMVPLVVGVSLVCQIGLTRATKAAFRDGLGKQGVLVETVGALDVVRAVGAGPMMAARWTNAVDRAAAGGLEQRRIAATAINVAASAQSLSYVATIVAGVGMVGDGALSTGALVACSLLSSRAVAPLGGIANLMTRMTHARASYRALDRLMRSGSSPPAPVRAPGALAVVFDKVSFTYPGAATPALAEISAEFAPGQRIGILGRSGSGKSTFASLIAGVHPPGAGKLLIGRHRSARMDRSAIGVVPQEPTLFSGSLRDNILLGRPELDDFDMLRAAALAGVDRFVDIKDLSAFDRPLADRGAGLSGGQRQAVAIARAFVHHPRLIVMDEPTSAMDPAFEAALIGRLAVALDGCTVFIVTHRAALLALVDRVIVLDRGRLAANGPRDVVLAAAAAPARATAA